MALLLVEMVAARGQTLQQQLDALMASTDIGRFCYARQSFLDDFRTQVLEVEDLPRTRSGKLAELAVSDIVNGREVRNTSALANAESLDAIAALFA